MGRLDGKVALVSGGARGIGAAIAQRFLDEGAKVVAGDVLDEDGRQLAADLGDGVRYVHLDVTQPADWDAAVSEAVTAFGSLSVLVNNAGIVNFGRIDEYSARGLGPDHRCEPDRRLQRHQGGGPGLGARRRRLHHQHLLDCGTPRLRVPLRLHGVEVRRPGPDQERRPGPRRVRNPRELGAPRRHRNAHDRGHDVRHRTCPPAPDRTTHGDRGPGGVPGSRRVLVRHGRRVRDRRRRDGRHRGATLHA